MRTDPNPEKSIRVLILDRNSLECQLMVWALEQSPEPISVAGCAAESTEMLKDLGENPNPPDVVIISADLKEGPATGLQVVRGVRASYPHIRIVVLVDFPERSMIVEGFRAGADGVFSRDEPFEMLCKCIHAVCKGQIWARSEHLRFIIDAIGGKNESRLIKNANGTKLLTKREEELVQLVAEGFTNRDISRELGLTEHTVRNYLFRIFNKLGTSNRLELALYVIKQRGTSQGSDLGRVRLAEPAQGLSAGRPVRDTGSLA